MPIPEYNLGGQEREGAPANEGISDIPKNRTLMAIKLTQEAPVGPEIVNGLTTAEEVFAHFQPSCDVEFADGEGASVSETLRFTNLGDFGKKGIVNQSNFLKDLQHQNDDFQQIAKVLKSNKILQKVLNDPAAREAYLGTLQALINQLEEVENNNE
jgi:hypothetical protein